MMTKHQPIMPKTISTRFEVRLSNDSETSSFQPNSEIEEDKPVEVEEEDVINDQEGPKHLFASKR